MSLKIFALPSILLTALLGAGGCRAKVEEPPMMPVLEAEAGSSLPAQVIPFGWKAGCSVPVRTAFTMDRTMVRATFQLDVAAADEGFVFSMSRYHVTSIDDRAPSDSARAKAMEMAGPTSWRIGPDGTFGGVIDTDGAMRAVLRGPIARGITPERRKMLESDPAMLAMVDTAIAKIWDPLVLIWVDMELGGETIDEKTTDTFDGTEYEMSMKVETLGRVAGKPELGLMRFATRQSIPSGALNGALGTISADNKGLPSGMLNVDTTILGAVDPATGRPHRVRVETDAKLKGQGAAEVRDTAFDWAASKGCD